MNGFGDGLDDEMLDLLVKRGVYWCPTFYVGVWRLAGLRQGLQSGITLVPMSEASRGPRIRRSMTPMQAWNSSYHNSFKPS